MSNPLAFVLKFRVEHPEQEADELIVEAGRALIGTGAHCEVRVGAGTAAREHADVVLDGEHVWVRALAAEPLMTLDGRACVQSEWVPGQSLRIGQTTISVEVVSQPRQPKKTSPLLALGLVPVFAAAWLVLQLLEAPRETMAAIQQPPRLFDASEVQCPTSDVVAAAAYAEEQLRIALAERERSPFFPAEGVQAVTKFRRAAACFRQAQDNKADQACSMADRLGERLEEDYRSRAVLLEHAYRMRDVSGMQRELSALRALTSHRSGAYVDWLAELDRFAREELAAQRRRQPLSRKRAGT
jgi:hypothetical protein